MQADATGSALEQALAAHGIEAKLRLVDGARLKSATRKALVEAKRGDIDAVVVGGGDGSVRCAASVLADTGVPLGVLPLGTLNHFARDAGIPLGLEAAAETIATGAARAVDLAEVNGEIFINNSSIGVYPYLVIARDQLRERHHGLAKWIAMGAAFVRVLRHFPRRWLKISIERTTKPYRTPCVLVGNNEYAVERFAPTRRKHLDRGELWLYVVKPRNPLGFFWMVCRVFFGTAGHTRDLDTFEAREAEILARASRLPVALDGEVEIMHPPLHYRSRPGALRVIVPKSRPATSASRGRGLMRTRA
jgi:diacylglycerol kinase family enzyme